MLIKVLRVGLGQLIVFIDLITRPRKLRRSAEVQAKVNQSARAFAASEEVSKETFNHGMRVFLSPSHAGCLSFFSR